MTIRDVYLDLWHRSFDYLEQAATADDQLAKNLGFVFASTLHISFLTRI
jgi:hypothetical protein